MVGVMGKRRVVLVDDAVLTTIPRTARNLLSKLTP